MPNVEAAAAGLGIHLVGHPFLASGRGEDLRCAFRAMRSVGMRPRITDVYGVSRPEPEHEKEFGPFLSPDCGALNIFFLNGDEIAQATTHLGQRWADSSYDIVYPAWELSTYPADWAKQLNRFDEVWAQSTFVFEALSRAVKPTTTRVPMAVEVVLSTFLGRRHFGIPESSYAFLFFFDVRSYPLRKNPEAVVHAFKKVLKSRPEKDAVLVIKVNAADNGIEYLRQFESSFGEIQKRIVLIKQSMTDNEVKNLVRCCDCFVSLHRSEGFGRGMAEAMYLGKPVIATAYSGNVDFCIDNHSLPVNFELIDLRQDDYPFAVGQCWADPSVDQAAKQMVQLLDTPNWGRELGRRASLFVRGKYGLRVVGGVFRSLLSNIPNAR